MKKTVYILLAIQDTFYFSNNLFTTFVKSFHLPLAVTLCILSQALI